MVTVDKNLKTESSKRLIPLHPFLIDKLHFPAFVAELMQRGENRLFPELKKESKGGYGRAMTRWFPNFREKAGVLQFDEEGRKRVFHSFRHTFTGVSEINDKGSHRPASAAVLAVGLL
jgi:integrase